jgi:predicted Zn-dependent protease
MKARTTLFIAGAALMAVVGASSLRGAFGLDKLNIDKALETAKNVGKVAKGVAGIGPEEERVIGESVAMEIVGKYGGLVRDEKISRRVNLVGRSLAYYSSRPALNWKFGVLDSPTVNAFSAPGGFVFITRGLYDLVGDDDNALAGALGHEITHITGRHALNIVARGEFLSGATELASDRSGDFRQAQAQLRQFDVGINDILKTLFERGFDPQTEYAADKGGRDLSMTVGYAPGGLRSVLVKLQKTGANAQSAFSTHPPLSDRIARLPAD